MTPADDTRCPDCRAPVLRTPGFVTWCRSCGWNVDPGADDAAEGRSALDRLQRRLARAAGRRQHRLLAARGSDPGRAPTVGTLALVLVLVLALAVHAVTLALAVGGVLLVVLGAPHVGLVVLGLLSTALAWSMRPRAGRLEGDVLVLDPAAAPTTYAALRRLSAALDGPVVDRVVLTGEVNAAVTRVGRRRRVVVLLGLPLWEALDDVERVALLGHEIGHLVHHDLRRVAVVLSAVDALREWWVALSPAGLGINDEATLLEGVTRVMTWPLRLVVLGLLRLLLVLSLQSGQRAEYAADGLGSRLGSTAAMLRALDVLLLGDGLEEAVRRAAVRRDPAPLGDVVRTFRASVPDLEWERLRRVSQLQGHQVDATHPPTHLRRDLVAGRPVEAGTGFFEVGETARIGAELAPYADEVQQATYAELRHVP